MSEDILLIDGLCALCTKTGKFISTRKSRILHIIEQDSEEGISLLKSHNITVDSLVLIRKNKPYIRSSAAVRCLLYMRWNWRFLYPIVWLIPLPIRDIIYKIVAKFRK